jgi:predicted  nucleic acid-binding Zn-ribbon protein
MEQETVQERLEVLEKEMTGLADLPEQVSGIRLQLSSLDSRLASVECRLTSVESRATSVESRLTSVESQIVRLETGMEDGFSAIRRDVRQLAKSTADGFARVDERFELMERKMDERFEETHTHMRILHEKLVSDIHTLYEGRQ